MVTPARRAANNRWDAANMAVLACKVKKDAADQVRAAAAKVGQSTAAYIWQAIQQRMNNDSRED